MAQYEIIADEAPYYTVKVTFADQEFTQQLVSDKKGKALTDQLQAYANEYEAAWVPAPLPEPPPVEDPAE